MLLDTAAPPAPRDDAASRETAAHDTHRAAAWEADVHRPADGEVAAGRDEAVVAEPGDRLVHRQRLDDPVEVEPQPGRTPEQRPAEGDLREP